MPRSASASSSQSRIWSLPKDSNGSFLPRTHSRPLIVTAASLDTFTSIYPGADTDSGYL